MLSRRAFGSLVGVATCIGAVTSSSAAPPTFDLDAIPLGVQEAAMRLAIAAAKTNPFYPFGAVIIGAADRAVLAQGVNNSKANAMLHGEMVAINDYVARHDKYRLGRWHPIHHGRALPDVYERRRLGPYGGVVYGSSFAVLVGRMIADWPKLSCHGPTMKARTKPIRK